MCLFGSVFLVGATFLYFGEIGPRRAISAAQSWVETPCEILESSVIAERGESESGNSPDAYAIDIRFKYQFAGQEYLSDRYDFSELKDGNEDWKHQTVADHPPGTTTVCFVNPDNPAQAVIRRGFGPIAGNSLGNWFLWIATAALMAIGLIGIGCFSIAPLGYAFDKVLQTADPQYVPGPFDNDPAEGEPTFTISPDRVRELLRVHGEVRQQDASDWRGDISLPEDIATFYRDVGPVNITIQAYGNSILIPSLSQLWDRQTAYRGTSAGNRLWNRIIEKLFGGWSSDWIVVAIDGNDLMIYSIHSRTILQALPGGGSWQPYEVYSDLNTMAACMAILGSVAIEAGEDLTDDESHLRPKYANRAISRLREELHNDSAAEAAFEAAGWGEAPRRA